MPTPAIIAAAFSFGLAAGTGTGWRVHVDAARAAQALEAAADSSAHEIEPPSQHEPDVVPVIDAEPAEGDSTATPLPAHEATDPEAQAVEPPAGEEPQPGALHEGDTTAVVDAPGGTDHQAADSAGPAGAPAIAPVIAPAASSERIARIFGAMRPEEAARLIEFLDEGQARTILFALPDRKAAAILANVKGERAGSLARALLPRPGGK